MQAMAGHLHPYSLHENVFALVSLFFAVCSNIFKCTILVQSPLHSLTGHPGGFNRIGGLRLDECSTYGCLMELTIQLAIIFVGKQILNNATELGVP